MLLKSCYYYTYLGINGHSATLGQLFIKAESKVSELPAPHDHLVYLWTVLCHIGVHVDDVVKMINPTTKLTTIVSKYANGNHDLESTSHDVYGSMYRLIVFGCHDGSLVFN